MAAGNVVMRFAIPPEVVYAGLPVDSTADDDVHTASIVTDDVAPAVVPTTANVTITVPANTVTVEAQ